MSWAEKKRGRLKEIGIRQASKIKDNWVEYRPVRLKAIGQRRDTYY
jgi:hypothetical protein